MTKDIDAVGLVRQIRDEIYEQTKGMSAKELVNYFRQHGASAKEKRELLEEMRAATRCEEVRALVEMDGMDLANPEIMARAWFSPTEIPAPSPPESGPLAGGSAGSR